MTFHKEPPHHHGRLPTTAILFINIGTPTEPTRVAVSHYLKEFLSDPRLVEVPKVIWWLILRMIILPLRSGKSAKKYAAVWQKTGSALRTFTAQQANLLQGYLGNKKHQVIVKYAMRYGEPAIPEIFAQLKHIGCERLLILPAYPQYCAATTASAMDAIFACYQKTRNLPELRMIKHYHDHPAYIHALAVLVLKFWAEYGRPETFIISFHGMPKRTLLLGDPYFCECQKTARLLIESLGLTAAKVRITFQSRFGYQDWLQPYTAPTLEKLAKAGCKTVHVFCPGFTSDCLETLEEIGIEAKQIFLQAGGKEFHCLPCLNDSPTFIQALTTIVEEHLQGWPTQLSAEDHKTLAQSAQDTVIRAQQLGAKQ